MEKVTEQTKAQTTSGQKAGWKRGPKRLKVAAVKWWAGETWGEKEDKQHWDQYRKQNAWGGGVSMELTGNK